jgi:hypothetical protein
MWRTVLADIAAGTDPAIAFVAEIDDTVVGIVHATDCIDADVSPRTGEITTLFVLPSGGGTRSVDACATSRVPV